MKPYKDHLKSSKNLETTYEAVRAGFIEIALEKNRRSTPFVAQARALKAAASRVRTPSDLLGIEEIQQGLLAAAGISDKAANHLQAGDKTEAIKNLIKNFLEPAGANFVEELVFRFLLTRGDTLGGSMRNIGGFMAQKKITRSILAHLNLAGKSCRWLHAETKIWADLPKDDTDIENQVRGLSWTVPEGERTLMYNLTIPFLGNNVDLSLFACAPDVMTKDVQKDPPAYLALGELKGGIDPAGADEHWKTAGTALNRIRQGFAKHNLKPHIFFVGAAIEARMASEIWEFLKKGILTNAANLTDDDQIASVVRWLCKL